MNAVEIEEAVSALVAEPFTRQSSHTSSLRRSASRTPPSKSSGWSVEHIRCSGAVLLRSNVHLIVTDAGKTTERLHALKASQKTAKGKAKFILATDGELRGRGPDQRRDRRLRLHRLPDHFGFFLPLAGITTVRQISENAFDIRATSRLNRLYVELLKDNPEWGTADAPPRHEPLHGAADLLLLRRGHRHLQRHAACSPPPSSR